MNALNRIWQAVKSRLGLAAAGGVGGTGAAHAFDWGEALQTASLVLSCILCLIWGWQAIEGARAKRAARKALDDGILENDKDAIKEALGD